MDNSSGMMFEKNALVKWLELGGGVIIPSGSKIKMVVPAL